MDAQIQALMAFYRQLEAEYRAEQERRIAEQRQRAQYLAQALAPIAGNIQDIVSRQTGASTAFAQGFSDALRQAADASSQGAASQLGSLGLPSGITPQGEAAANALYGEKGFIPATGFSNYGAAQAAAAALLPATALRQGEAGIADIYRQFDEGPLRDLRLKRLELVAKRPEMLAEQRDKLRKEALDLYQAGLLTQREFAKRMGVKNWRKFPNTLPGADPEIRTVGNSLVAIDPKTGRASVIYQAPEDPEIRTQGGYIWERDPKTGKWTPVGGTGQKGSSYQTKQIGGKTYVFDPNTGTFYDPKTGKPTVPRSGRGSQFTAKQRQEWKGQSHALAQDFRYGIPAEETEDGKEVPKRTYGEAIQEGLRAGIPLEILIPILNRYYPPGVQGRPANVKRLRDYPEGPGRQSGKGEPAESGRKNIVLAQKAGFTAHPEVVDTITSVSARHKLDPLAVMAVALAEGGLTYGAVGDNGTSFGPFQLHVGGALPRNKDAAWANSPAGIEYALRKMAQAGARGLRGLDAIAAIVRRFERPADPEAEIARAYGYYQRLLGAQEV